MTLTDLTNYWNIVETGQPHLVGEGMSMTHAYIKHSTVFKAPLEFHQMISQPKETKTVFTELKKPAKLMFYDMKVGDSFTIKTTAGKSMQCTLIGGLKGFNKIEGVSHSYKSHYDKNKVSMRRVG